MDDSAHMQCRTRRVCSVKSTFPRAALSEMMKKVAFCASVSGAFTHKSRRARSNTRGLCTAPADQCLNRCVPTLELLLSADIGSCAYSQHVWVCVCEYLRHQDAQRHSAILDEGSNRVCVRETGGVRINEWTRGAFSSWRSKPRFA